MSPSRAVVIGAGVIGLAVAQRLDGDGWLVEVVDAAPQRPPASAAAAGMLAPLAEAPIEGAFFDTCREARDLWRSWAPDLETRSGIDLDFDTSGCLLPVLTDADSGFAEHLAEVARTAGEAAEWLARQDLNEHLPALSEKAGRALLLSDELRVDNLRVLEALERVLARRRVPVRRPWTVRGLEATSSGVRLRGDRSQIEADLVVVAAGAWSASLLGPATPSVRPVRGQMISYAEFDTRWTGTVRGEDSYAVMRRRDGLVVGASVEEVGFDLSTGGVAVDRLRRFAERLFPALQERSPTQVWAGLRPASVDGHPLIGFVDDPSVLLVSGHFRNGILLAPWTANEVARLVEGGGEEGAFSPRDRS